MFWGRNSAFPTDNAVHIDRKLISIVYSGEDEYSARLELYIKEAAEKAGYEFILKDSKNSELLQLTQVENALKQDAKGIIINLVSSNSAPQILKSAEAMNIIFVTVPPADMNILNQNAIYIGSKETTAGIIQGEWLSNYYKERGITEIRYILLQDLPKMISTAQRSEAVLQTLAQNGITAIPATPPIVANYMRRDAMSQMLPILRSGVRFDTIISNNDSMALGAIAAMESLSMDPSRKVIVGIDATEPAVRAILQGKMAMTVFQNAKAQGSTAVRVYINMLDGNPISLGTGYQVSAENPYIIWIPFELVTRFHIPQDIYF